MRFPSCAAVLAAVASLSVRTAAQDVPAPGFALAPLPLASGSPFAVSTTLANGEIVLFDGTAVTQHAPDGSLLFTLGTLPAFVFPSFVLVDPNEQFVLFGESSTGAIQRLFLGLSSSPDFLVALPFNYDAAMADDTAVFVSAATCGFGCGSEIWRVDLVTLAATLEVQLVGASGPLVFDDTGGLYSGTVADFFPPPPDGSAVLRWSAAQLAGAQVLLEADAQLVAAGFSGAARLAYDSEQKALYLLENNFATGLNRVRRVQSSAAQSPVLVEGRNGLSMGNLSFHALPDAATFRAHQPASGGRLEFTSTDFGALLERQVLTPLRPSLVVSGAGTGGPGPFEVRLTDGPPAGFARVFLGSSAQVLTPEQQFPFARLPLFLALNPSGASAIPGLLLLDSQGEYAQSFTNPGGYEGQFAFQFLLLDAERRVEGTSAVGFL